MRSHTLAERVASSGARETAHRSSVSGQRSGRGGLGQRRRLVSGHREDHERSLLVVGCRPGERDHPDAGDHSVGRRWCLAGLRRRRCGRRPRAGRRRRRHGCGSARPPVRADSPPAGSGRAPDDRSAPRRLAAVRPRRGRGPRRPSPARRRARRTAAWRPPARRLATSTTPAARSWDATATGRVAGAAGASVSMTASTAMPASTALSGLRNLASSRRTRRTSSVQIGHPARLGTARGRTDAVPVDRTAAGAAVDQ